MSEPMAHRLQFGAALRSVRTALAELAALASSDISDATRAVLEQDPALAAAVVRRADQVRARRLHIDGELASLITLQAPVAGDLRLLVAALRMVVALERMAELAGHVAELVLHSHPEPVVPEELRAVVTELGGLCSHLAAQVGRAVETADVALARQLERDDDAVDEAHRQLLNAVTGPDWSHGVRFAVEVTLLGRFYERFADQAVTVARRLDYLQTGKAPTP